MYKVASSKTGAAADVFGTTTVGKLTVEMEIIGGAVESAHVVRSSAGSARMAEWEPEKTVDRGMLANYRSAAGDTRSPVGHGCPCHRKRMRVDYY
jgi:hypothetical protein